MEDGDRDRSLDRLGMDLDLDSPAQAPARPARFQPKIKGKLIKAEPIANSESLPPPIPVKKQEDVASVANADEPLHDPSVLLPGTDDKEETADDPMEADDDDEEDTVVREFDVFFTSSPLDEDTWLYVMQYPLRPSWRPYELSERCEEVRVKPKQSKVEVELSLDVESENYDQEVAEPLRLQKQTLSSSKAPSITDFAVGILMGNQLHLNPVHAAVQLRPSMAHINVGVQKRKHGAQNLEVNTKSYEENLEESLKPSIRQGKLMREDSSENIDDAEPWVHLEYHSIDSCFSGSYQEKIVAEKNNHIQFTVKLSDYVNSLCPGTSTDNKNAVGPPRRVLLSMPLEERLRKWLCEGPQVNRLVPLLYLAPTDSIEDVLKVLQRYADLVQGLWVTKSSLLYEGSEALTRDYILFLFSKSLVICNDKLKDLKLNIVKRLLSPLAVERPKLNDWKFKEAADLSFIKCYPDIVKEQECAWSNREKHVMNSLRVGKNMSGMKNSPNSNFVQRATGSSKVDPGHYNGKGETVSSMATTMLNGTREALVKAFLELFRLHKVYSLNSIIQGLKGRVNAPLPELQSVISQLAVNIHGVYVLKSLGNPALDPLRNVVISLFQGKEPNAKLRRQEIRQAALLSIKRDISDSEYNQVVNELCVASRGALLLKSGDFKPEMRIT